MRESGGGCSLKRYNCSNYVGILSLGRRGALLFLRALEGRALELYKGRLVTRQTLKLKKFFVLLSIPLGASDTVGLSKREGASLSPHPSCSF